MKRFLRVRLALPYSVFGVAALLVVACGPQRTGFVPRTYHNMVSYFNGYYHAEKNYHEALKSREAQEKMPPDGFISLLGKGTNTGSNLAQFDTAIKKCDVIIFRHPNSNWLDDCRFLNGRCYFYKDNLNMAASNFRFILYKYPDSKLVPQAKLWLAKTYYMEGNALRARELLKDLPADELDKADVRVEMARMQSQLMIEQKQYSEAIALLENTLPDVKRRRDKAQFHFLLGQLYAQMDQFPQAADHFATVARLNISNEYTFRALLGTAALYTSRSRQDPAQLSLVRKKLDKLLNDLKYEEYHDQIYYQYALIEEGAGNVPGAVGYLRKSLGAGKSNPLQAVRTYFKTGSLYFTPLQRYDSAQAYLDSAASLAKPEMPEYETIKNMSAALNDYVKHRRTIKQQDSLLALGNLDSTALVREIERIIKKEDEEKKKREQAEKARQAELQRLAQQTQDPRETDPFGLTGSKFYFDDQTQVARGQADFARVWGRRPNEDHWRRRNKMVLAGAQNAEAEDEENVDDATDPDARIRRYFARVPRTAGRRDTAQARIEEALFELGQLFYQRFGQPDSALRYYALVHKRYPERPLAPKALYASYTIHQERRDARRTSVAENIINQYPNSIYAKLVRNAGAEDLDPSSGNFDVGYATLLGMYDAAEYETVVHFGNFLHAQHLSHPEVDKVLFLRGAGFGGMGKTDSLKAIYGFLVQNYPQTEGGRMAKLALAALENPHATLADATQTSTAGVPFGVPEERYKGFEQKGRPGDAYYAVIFVDKDKIKTTDINLKFSNLNKRSYPELNLRTSVFSYKTDSVDKHMVYITQFKSFNLVKAYLKLVQNEPELAGMLSDPEADLMFITPPNFRVAFGQRRFHDYQAFLKQYGKQIDELNSQTEGK